MNRKNTIGPWEAKIVSDYKPNTILETYIKQIVILGPVKEDGWQSHIAEVNLQFGEEQSSANAHLMAAAPELLEQVKQALKFCRAEGIDQTWECALEKVIAKAEGTN